MLISGCEDALHNYDFSLQIEIEENTKSTQCILDMQTKERLTPKTFFKDKSVCMYKKHIKTQIFNVILTVAQV